MFFKNLSGIKMSNCFNFGSILSIEFAEVINGITGIIKSKNLLLLLFLNTSSLMAYTKVILRPICRQLFMRVFNSLSLVKISGLLKRSRSSIITTS